MSADTIIHGAHFLVSLPLVNANISITNNIKYNIANHVIKLIRILLCKFRFVEMILPQPAGMCKNSRGGGPLRLFIGC